VVDGAGGIAVAISDDGTRGATRCRREISELPSMRLPGAMATPDA
jgi:hypothetical protein